MLTSAGVWATVRLVWTLVLAVVDKADWSKSALLAADLVSTGLAFACCCACLSALAELSDCLATRAFLVEVLPAFGLCCTGACVDLALDFGCSSVGNCLRNGGTTFSCSMTN